MSLDDPNEVRINLQFLEWVLRIRGVDDAITGTAQPQITRQSLKAVTIPVPHIDRQQAFADRVEAIEEAKRYHERALTAVEALFTSLQARAFRGEL